MRILQLASAFAYTGPAEPMLALCTELARLGHDVTIGHDTVRPQGNAHEEGMGPRVAQTGLPVASELALCTRSGPVTWLRDLARLRRRMASIDITHAHFSHDHGLAQAARIAGAPGAVVRTVHAERSLDHTAMLRRADAVVVHSEHARAMAVERALDPNRIHVIPGPVDLLRFNAEARNARRQAFRQRHKLGGPALLMAAIFQKGRGQSQLVGLWPAVRAVLPGAELWFAGLGEERDAVMQQAAGVPGVHFLGYLDEELPDAYAAADASVLLRIGNDGYGRAALQSLACGTPVLTQADCHAVADVVTARQVGALLGAEPADQIIRMLREPVDATACRTAVERHHSVEAVTAQTVAVYRAVLQSQALTVP